MDPLVHLEGITVARGGRPILRSLDLDVAAGEVVGVAGPNGTGKTTLIRMLATLLAPSRGSGSVLGASLGTTEVYPVRPAIGLIGHVPSVIQALTLEENLVHAARLGGIDPSRVGRALRVVGLERAGDRPAGSSSFGMLRRTEVARLLLSDPRLLLLDEALTGLDQPAQALIDILVERSLRSGGAVVMVSHDEDLLRDHTERVYGLVDGRLEVMV